MSVTGPLLSLAAIVAGLTAGPAATLLGQVPDPGLSGPPPLVRGTGVVRGRVIDGTRGAPIARASVTAFVSVMSPAAGAPRRQTSASYTARTEADGTFVFTGVPASWVGLSVHKDGYYPAAPARRVDGAARSRLAVDEGATVTAPDLLLVRGGVITGRVTDALGEPLIRAQVVPLARFGDPAQPFRMAGSPAQTDDRGLYRLYGLRAGRYTVQVVPRGARQGPPIGTIQGDPREPLRAFAPGTTEVGAAEFVEVTHGVQATLDVRVPVGRSALVSGQVVADDTTPLATVFVSLRPADSRVDLHIGGARVDGAGHFALPDIPPGRYQLVAEEALPSRGPASPMRPGRSGKTDVVVEGEDVSGIAVPIGPGTTVHGRVEVEGGSADTLAERPLRLSSRRHPSEALSSRVAEVDVLPDLTFTMTGLHGRQQVRAMGLPDGWWVKSITIDGRDALAGYDYPRRGTLDDMVVVVSARPTGVAGRVEARPDVPAEALVIAIADPGDGDSAHLDWQIRFQPIQQDGTFAMRGLRPGRYVIAALTQDALVARGDGNPAEQAEFVRAVGAAIDVVEGRMVTAMLRLVDEPPQ